MNYTPASDNPSRQREWLGEDGISGKDSEVLNVIGEEDLASFTFEGLKRRMGAHPETLSRTLDRLEEQEILEKSGGVYRLTGRGRDLLGGHPLSGDPLRIFLVRTLLPFTIPLHEVISTLEGRWFGQLRWLGRSETPGETVLKWVTADGKVQLDALLSGGELRIEGRLLHGEDMVGAIRASHQLLTHISRVYARQPSKRNLIFGAVPATFMQN